MDSRAIRLRNLQALVEEKGSIAQLARESDTAASYLSQILGKSKSSKTGQPRGMGHDLARKIEGKLGLSEGWMDVEHRLQAVSEPRESYGDNVTPIDRSRMQTRMYPLISWVQAGNWGETVDHFGPGEADDWMPAPPGVRAGPLAFWLEVSGLSMINPTGGQSYHPGSLILVDPDVRACETGALVIAKLNDTNETTFKKVNYEAGRIYLQPLNPQYPVIEITSEAQIVGTICSAIIRV